MYASYASFGDEPTAAMPEYQTLPADAEVLVPAGTPLFVLQAPGDVTDPAAPMRQRVVMQDTFSVRLPEPVDVLFAEEAAKAAEEQPITVTVAVPEEKSEPESPWYKSPAFIGGVVSVMAFSVVAFLQSRAESKIK